MAKPGKQYWEAKDAAVEMGISKRTFHRMAAGAKVKGMRISRGNVNGPIALYTVADLEKIAAYREKLLARKPKISARRMHPR